MNRLRIVSIVGTRPEAIKMAPVMKLLNADEGFFDHIVVSTAQHREMLDQVLSAFGIKPNIDLGLMQEDQSLGEFASRCLAALSEVMDKTEPDAVLIQGDTSTVMTAALAAFYREVHIAHVEAGLRSFDRRNPFPEEINRRIVGSLADMHFAPTQRARLNLLREGVPEQEIFVTGNTIVDALQSMPLTGDFEDKLLSRVDFDHRRVLLVTAHRRENHGSPLRSICKALKSLVGSFEDIEIVYPVHLNPNVSTVVRQEIGDTARIHLVPPASYCDLLRVMSRCYLILTDSGGIQEEAPSFRKPVLVLRDVTERPEVIEVGAGRVVGTDSSEIIQEVARLLVDRREYERMSTCENPFGDGQAASRIVNILAERLQSGVNKKIAFLGRSSVCVET